MLDEKDGPNEGRLSSRLSRLSPERQALYLRMLGRDASARRPAAQAPAAEPVAREGDRQLSFMQEERLLHQQRMREQSVEPPPCPVPLVFRLEGGLDAAALEAAVDEVRRRHEILRAVFPVVDGLHVLRITPFRHEQLTLHDLSATPEPERDEALMRLVRAEVKRPFDLEGGPLFRASLVRLGADEHVLVGVVEHLVFDGFSTRILLREIGSLYHSFAGGQPPALPEPPAQYAEVVSRQRARLEGPALPGLLDYWRGKFGEGDIFPELVLPGARPVESASPSAAARQSVKLPASVLESLAELGRQKASSPFNLMLAALKLLLHHYTGRERVGVITAVENRAAPETRALIGWFAHSVILTTDLTGDPTFTQLLDRVRLTTVEALEHTGLPIQRLLRLLRPEEYQRVVTAPRDTFGADYFYFESVKATTPSLELQGLKVSPVRFTSELRLNSTSLVAAAREQGLWLESVYQQERYPAAVMAGFLEDFGRLLVKVAAEPDRRISELKP